MTGEKQEVKVSDLTPSSSFKGLWTLGYQFINGIKTSVRVSLEAIQTAYDNTIKATESANTAAGKADKAATDAGTVMVQISANVNLAIGETNKAKDAATAAAVNAKSVSDHPGYIGSDYHVYTWDYVTGAYKKTETILRPEGFSIYRSYPSIAVMNADLFNVPEGKFVLINTNDVDQTDDAKLYVRGAASFEYLVDMSGAIGFTGKTPQFSIGTVSKGDSPSATISENGIDANGNPQYKINLVLPKGDSGANGKTPVVEMGTVTTGQPGSSASATLTPNGVDASGNPKYLLALTIPRGDVGSLGSGDAKDLIVTFVEAGARTNIASGEKMSIMFGKIGKWFADLKAVAFSGSYNDLSNKPTIPTNNNQLTNGSGFITNTELNAHNTSSTAHSDIRQAISEVDAIARGKARAKVFDTVAALDTWLGVSANVATLQVGDNFYIKALDVPDYWWDGDAKQPIESEKVDLTNYVQKEAGKGLFSGSYNDLSNKPTIPTVPGVATSTVDGLMSSDDKKKLDRKESYTTASTVASLNADYEYIYVTLNANASLSVSVAGTDYNGRFIMVYIYCSSARTIAIPTTGNYVSMCGSSYTCPAGKWVEFNLECIAGIWHIAKLEQE